MRMSVAKNRQRHEPRWSESENCAVTIHSNLPTGKKEKNEKKRKITKEKKPTT